MDICKACRRVYPFNLSPFCTPLIVTEPGIELHVP